MNTAYIQRARTDILNRATTVRLNGATDVPISTKTDSGGKIVINTGNIEMTTPVTSVALLDENGGVITNRTTNFTPAAGKPLVFTFEFNVRGERK
ncbi:hypothetical protein M3221_13495 [Domibacillus indicus]|uniref:hypothetical protein n=1 Tax=Domibacillus indicus TaxID=1437523 RepID=UPI00203CF9F1|nr:hypothetical protein [Domibacillus indicus]MCM3789414.1 hypothetical protein [Domibacillus indicus]